MMVSSTDIIQLTPSSVVAPLPPWKHTGFMWALGGRFGCICVLPELQWLEGNGWGGLGFMNPKPFASWCPYFCSILRLLASWSSWNTMDRMGLVLSKQSSPTYNKTIVSMEWVYVDETLLARILCLDSS
jgi:hypothetical protein